MPEGKEPQTFKTLPNVCFVNMCSQTWNKQNPYLTKWLCCLHYYIKRGECCIKKRKLFNFLLVRVYHIIVYFQVDRPLWAAECFTKKYEHLQWLIWTLNGQSATWRQGFLFSIEFSNSKFNCQGVNRMKSPLKIIKVFSVTEYSLKVVTDVSENNILCHT